MKPLLKIETIMIFLVCSVAIYLDYSFNSHNILMNKNTIVEYESVRYDNQNSFSSSIDKIAKDNDVYIYYADFGTDINYYASSNYKVEGEYLSNEVNNKQLKVPSTYRKIRIYPMDGSNFNYESGTLILEGTSENIDKVLTELNNEGISITSKNTVSHEDSEYFLQFAPIIGMLMLLIGITISFEILKQSKKISIMYLEGYSRGEIIVLNFKKNHFFLTIFLTITIIVNLIVVIIFNNENFVLNYVSGMALLLALLIAETILVNILLIKRFEISKLKNLVNINIPLILLYIFKVVCIFGLLLSCTYITIFIRGYNTQTKQLEYNKYLNGYYSYKMKNVAINDSNKESLINLYEDLIIDKNPLLTISNKCIIGENSWDPDSMCMEGNSHFIVSPAYIKMVDKNFNQEALTNGINVFVGKSSNTSEEEIREEYNIEKSTDINISQINKETIPLISSDYNISFNKYDSVIVLNQNLIDSSSVINENIFYYMQNVYLQLNEENPYEDLSELLKKYKFENTITNVNSISEIKESYVATLIKKIEINLGILVIVLSSILVTIIINNKLYQILLSKKQALMILEGYSYKEIYKNRILANVMCYLIGNVLLLTYDRMTVNLSLIFGALFVSIIVFIADSFLEKYIFQKSTISRITSLLKGDS